MLKKSKTYKGYILLEGLFSLGLLCLIIGSYVLFNQFLLQKNRQVQDQLSLHRVLYEEIKRYENYGGKLQAEISVNGINYQLHFYKNHQELLEVEITDGKEFLSIKKATNKK